MPEYVSGNYNKIFKYHTKVIRIGKTHVDLYILS